MLVEWFLIGICLGLIFGYETIPEVEANDE